MFHQIKNLMYRSFSFTPWSVRYSVFICIFHKTTKITVVSWIAKSMYSELIVTPYFCKEFEFLLLLHILKIFLIHPCSMNQQFYLINNLMYKELRFNLYFCKEFLFPLFLRILKTFFIHPFSWQEYQNSIVMCFTESQI